MPLLLLLLLLSTSVCAQPPPVLRGWLPPVDPSLNATTPAPWARGADPAFPFLRVQGTQLFANETPFYAVGANMWHLDLLAAPAGPGADRARMTAELDDLARSGVTHVRLIAGGEGPDSEPWRSVPSLQPCPGHYDVSLLDGLDYALFELGQRRMRATLVLGQTWPWSGGWAAYLQWAAANASWPAASCEPGSPPEGSMGNATWLQQGGSGLPYPGPGHPAAGGGWKEWQALAGGFYESGPAMELWRAHVRFLLTRVNRYTGVSLADDPTVAFLELANEPRPANATAAAAAPFLAWLASSARFLKALAPHTLVAAGMEGDTSHINLGQAALLSQADPALDVITAHVWPQNYQWLQPCSPRDGPFGAPAALARSRAYVDAHIAYASVLGKPLLFEEFNWPRGGGSLSPQAGTEERDAFFAMMLGRLSASAETGGVLAMATFWGYSGRGRPDSRYAAMPSSLGGAEAPAPASSPSNAPLTSLYNTPVDWAACFTDEGARPNACPFWVWWTQPASWAGQLRGQNALLNGASRPSPSQPQRSLAAQTRRTRRRDGTPSTTAM